MKPLFTSLLLLFISLIFVGCSTLRVATDYDKSFNMSTLHSFYILHKKAAFKEDTLTTNRINKALITTLQAKNYQLSNKESADFYVVYHLNVTNKTQIDTDYQFVGMYPYRYGRGMVATTRSYNYDEGKLIIDIINPNDKNIIFRSIATDELKRLETPQEREAYINEVISKALKSMPSKH